MSVTQLAPYAIAAAISKDDTTKITPVAGSDGNVRYPDAILIGGAGNVVLLLADGTVTSAITVIAGQILPLRVQRVNSTNTTATNMVALWY